MVSRISKWVLHIFLGLSLFTRPVAAEQITQMLQG